MSRRTTSSGSASRTAYRVTYQTAKERRVRIYWSPKALAEKLQRIREAGEQLLKIEKASVRWVQKVP